MGNLSTPETVRSITCPICERGLLQTLGRDSARCDACQALVGAPLFAILRDILELPDAAGRHACECGHPEMRRLPDAVYWCPACGSEVLPVAPPPAPWDSGGHSEAYWSGWMDGRFKELGSFATNGSLKRWNEASERLDYYRGHRSGREARKSRLRSRARLAFVS